MKKRILAVTLVLCMLLPIIPFSSFASAAAVANMEDSRFWRDVTIGDVPLETWYRSGAADVGFGDKTVTDYAAYMTAFDKMVGFGDIDVAPFVYTDGAVTEEITDLTALWPDGDNRYDNVAESVKTAMNKTIANGYITREVIGQATSTADRGINVLQYMYSYTLDPTQEFGYVGPTNIPKIIICAGTQSDEVGSIFGLYYLISEMLKDDGSDPILSYLRNNVKLVLIPCLSPGGINNATYWNANGVNLNRGYDYGFHNVGGYAADGVTPVRGGKYDTSGNLVESAQRSGITPFEQAENCAMRDLFADNMDAFYYIDFHTNSHTITSYNSTTKQYEVNWQNANWYSLSTLEDDYFARLYDAAVWQLDRVNTYFKEDYFAAYGATDDIRIGKITVSVNNNPATGSGTSQRYAQSLGILPSTLEGITGIFAREAVAGKPTEAQLNGAINMDSYSFGAQKMCSEELANWLMAVLGVYANDGDLPDATYSTVFEPAGENFPTISGMTKDSYTGAYDTGLEKYPNRNSAGTGAALEDLSAYGDYTLTFNGGWELGYKIVNTDGSLRTENDTSFNRYDRVFFYDSNWGGATKLQEDGTWDSDRFREAYITGSTWMKNNDGGFGLGAPILSPQQISTANTVWSGYHASAHGGWHSAATIRYTAEYTGDVTIDITNLVFFGNAQEIEIRKNGVLIGTVTPTKDICQYWLDTETGVWGSGDYNDEYPGYYSIDTTVTKGDLVEFVARVKTDVTEADGLDGSNDTEKWKRSLSNYKIKISYHLAYKQHVDADYTGTSDAVTYTDIQKTTSGSRAAILQFVRWYTDATCTTEVGYSGGEIPTDGHAKINKALYDAGILTGTETMAEAIEKYEKYLISEAEKTAFTSQSGWLPGGLDDGRGLSHAVTTFSPFYIRSFLSGRNLLALNVTSSGTYHWRGNQEGWNETASWLVTKPYFERQMEVFTSISDGLVGLCGTTAVSEVTIPLAKVVDGTVVLPKIGSYAENKDIDGCVSSCRLDLSDYYGTLLRARGLGSQTVGLSYTVPQGAKGKATLAFTSLYHGGTANSTFTWSLLLNGVEIAKSDSAVSLGEASTAFTADQLTALNAPLTALGAFDVKAGDVLELRFKKGTNDLQIAPGVSLDIDNGNGEADYVYGGIADDTALNFPALGSWCSNSNDVPSNLLQLFCWYDKDGNAISVNDGALAEGAYAMINENLFATEYIAQEASWTDVLNGYRKYLLDASSVTSESGWLPGALDEGSSTAATVYSPFYARTFLARSNLFGIRVLASDGSYVWRGNKWAWDDSTAVVTKDYYEMQLDKFFSATAQLANQPTEQADTLKIYLSDIDVANLPAIGRYNEGDQDTLPTAGYATLGTETYGLALMNTRGMGSMTVSLGYVVPKDTVGTATLSLDNLYFASTGTFSWSLMLNGVALAASDGNIAVDGAQDAIAEAIAAVGSFDIKTGDLIELRFKRGDANVSVAPGVTLHVTAEVKTETEPMRSVQLTSGGAILSDELVVVGESVADIIAAYNEKNGTSFAANGCYINGVWYDASAELPAIGLWDVVIDDLKIEASASIAIGATYSINVYLPALTGATAAGVKVNGEDLPATLTDGQYKVTVSTDYAKDLLDREVTYTPYYVIDGEEAVSAKAFTTTAEELLTAYISGDYTAEAKALAQAALDYATVAKAYFADETVDAATLTRLATYDDEITAQTASTVVTAGEKYTFTAATLQIGETINFILAVGNADGTALTTLDGVDVKLNGTAVTPSVTETATVGGRQVVVLIFEGVPEREFENSQTFTVGDAELEYSVKDYCVRTFNSAAEAEKNMIRAVYALGAAATAYGA